MPVLPEQLEGVTGRALRAGTLWLSPVFLDEVSLECRRDFVDCLQRVVDGPVPRGVVNHVASIAARPPVPPQAHVYQLGTVTVDPPEQPRPAVAGLALIALDAGPLHVLGIGGSILGLDRPAPDSRDHLGYSLTRRQCRLADEPSWRQH